MLFLKNCILYPIRMWPSSFILTTVSLLSLAFISNCHAQEDDEYEYPDLACETDQKCTDNVSFEVNCECDRNCTAYDDCCMDALHSQGTPSSTPEIRTNVKCIHLDNRTVLYEHFKSSGVYAISKCINDWNGPKEVREKCESSDTYDFNDPLSDAPVIDVAQQETYRNMACADCNNANLTSLKYFRLVLECWDYLDGLTDQQILDNLTYDQQSNSWGVYRVNKYSNEKEFVSCDMMFDVPNYLVDNVRFCASGLISSCAADWEQVETANLCKQYMDVVYSDDKLYRNKHCAFCNRKSVKEIYCRSLLSPYKKTPSFFLSLDINLNDGFEVWGNPVTTTECPPGRIYDPFLKKCRMPMCSLPGYFIVDMKCWLG